MMVGGGGEGRWCRGVRGKEGPGVGGHWGRGACWRDLWWGMNHSGSFATNVWLVSQQPCPGCNTESQDLIQ